MTHMKQVDVLVKGAGIVGQTVALLLTRLGLHVGLVHSQPPQVKSVDVRAYALNHVSVDCFKNLKVWEVLPPHTATPVYDMQIQGDAQGQLTFSAWQQCIPQLAWIVDAASLENQLNQALQYAPHLHRISEAQAQQWQAPLTVLCEGKHSSSRQELGVEFEQKSFGHTAIAARLTSSQPHAGMACQWFQSPQVLALLPLDQPAPDYSYALVWSVPHENAERLMQIESKCFEQELNRTAAPLVGALSLASERAAWPLVDANAVRWAGPGWVLVGDAAHVVHPLAGQGLNLGLADAMDLTQVLTERELWRPLGDEKLLQRYVVQRSTPTRAMSGITRGLFYLFSNPHPLMRQVRNRGLSLVNHLDPAKRWLAKQAIGKV
jgi:ubiquinone biosynthesis UbiH/UbiF/VisC/COQ6 family hydroxylase